MKHMMNNDKDTDADTWTKNLCAVLFDICVFAAVWLFVAMFLSLVVRFIAYLCSAGWSYWAILWNLFLWGLLPIVTLVTVGDMLWMPWKKVYNRECTNGLDKSLAFEKACKDVPIRLPRWLLSLIVELREKFFNIIDSW